MLLRICLILTIVAGLATAYLGFFPVQEIITTTRAARDDFNKKFTDETQLYNKTVATLRKTKDALDTTTAKLTETQTELEAANTKNTELEKQSADLTEKLVKMTARADADEQKLEQWNQLPSPGETKGMMEELAQAKKARDAFAGENKLLLAKANGLQRELDGLIGPDQPVIMRDGLKGKVLAVDPKYDFVVLDIGDEQGAKERGEMMINRQGKLIGKVRIGRVEKDRCVATIMPAWKRGQVMEGDQVIY
jgi:cell shape-determining protein MreC